MIIRLPDMQPDFSRSAPYEKGCDSVSSIRECDIVPFFQPILSADKDGVFGYEVLGRLKQGGEILSLGKFFDDPDVSCTEKAAVDAIVRRKAILKYIEHGCYERLFLNLKPEWICAFPDAYSPLSLLGGMPQNLSFLNRIVIEITEENLPEDAMETLMSATLQLQKAGCLLAIDDFGRGSSNLDRIAWLRPDIVKVDRSIIQQMEYNEEYRRICKATNQFAEIMGFDILFEGIENTEQLRHCVEAEGRYFQGFFFSPPLPLPEEGAYNRDLVLDYLGNHRKKEVRRARWIREFAVMIDRYAGEHLERISTSMFHLFPNDGLKRFAQGLPAEFCIRFYICDRSGRQISYNYNITRSGEIAVDDFRDSNWLFRPYFHKALCQLGQHGESMVTEAYRDIHSRELIRTYIRLMEGGRFFLVDFFEGELVEEGESVAAL